MQSSINEFDALIYEAERMCDRRNPEAQKLIEQAVAIAESTGDVRQNILVKYIQSDYDCLVSNNYERAINSLTNTLLNLDLENYSSFAYRFYMTLGNSYQLKGDVFSAQESYIKGLRILEVREKLTAEEQKFLASFYYNIYNVMTTSELRIGSEEYIEKAISVASQAGLNSHLSKCYSAYAQMFERKEDYHTAIKYLNKAIDVIDDHIADAYSLALAKANLGILSVKVNEYETSFTYLNDSLEYFQSNNLNLESAMVKFELGQSYIYVGNYETGLQHISSAEEVMISLDNKKELSDIYKIKAQILSKRGEHEAANKYLEKYIESLKFFFDNEKTNALTRAKNEFESEQKEKEAKLLRQKNEEIQEYVYKLEISNNELRQFAHVASHDLREPLRMIVSYLSLLKRGLNDKMTEQEVEFFGFVVNGAKRMDLLIQDLLRLAKVDANPLPEKVKLANVIEEIKLNLDALIKEKHAVVQVIGQIPVIVADRTQMLQLFQNLIANGIKYNKNATPQVTIKYIDSNDKVCLLVTDNGIGIPGHLKEEAFQIFKRLHVNADVTGSGIGLAICKKIVEGMHGKIKIEDRPEGGTVFKITLSKQVVQPAKQ